MKLTLEKILEEFSGYEAIAIASDLFLCNIPDNHIKVLLFVYKANTKQYLEHGIIPANTISLTFPDNFIDYTGDWRDSLRSRSEIENNTISLKNIAIIDSYEWYRCPCCAGVSIEIKSKFCPDCGIKLKWVD